MAESLSVIVVDSDPDSRSFIRAQLGGVEGVTIKAETADLGEGVHLLRQLRPQILLLELGPSPEETLEVVRRIGEVSPATHVFLTSKQSRPEIIIEAMRAGAREFLLRPLDGGELVAAFRRAPRLGRPASPALPAEAERPKGRVLVFFGAKGGVGCTTILVNLGVSLAGSGRSVVLVDLDLQGGNVATFLNVQPRYTIADVAKGAAEMDVEAVRGSLVSHRSGAYVLAEPQRIEEVEAISQARVSHILGVLAGLFDYVLVDASQSFSEVTLEALERADFVFLVSLLDIPTLRNTRRILELFGSLGYGRDKVKLVINRYQHHREVPLDVFERIISYPVFCRIPNDYPAVAESIATGEPLSLRAASTPLAASFREMAGQLDGRRGPAHDGRADATPAKGLLRRLLSVRGGRE